MTWSELVNAYCSAQAVRGRPAYAEKLRYSLGRFGRYLGQAHACPPEPEALLGTHLAAYQIDLESQNLSPHTVCGWLKDLRACLRWAARRGHLLLDLTADWSVPHPPAPFFRLLTVAEVERLLEAPDPVTPMGLRDRALLECLYGLALRRAECLGLDVPDVDFATHTVRVNRVKGGRTRFLPLPAQLAQVFEHYLEHGRPSLLRSSQESALFLGSQTGQRLGPVRLGALVGLYARRARLPAVSPHKLRHACASHLLEAGADLRVVQELLGHAQVSSTQFYTQLVPEAVMRTHRRTHPRARRRR